MTAADAGAHLAACAALIERHPEEYAELLERAGGPGRARRIW